MSEQDYRKQQQTNSIPSGNDSSTKIGAHDNGSTSKEADIEADKSESDKEGKLNLQPNPSYDPIITCLKVSPTLFTPEKLNLFDTVALYTTLINRSQHIEQGERLNNLSWRIINKAMLKNKAINASKKRDGVKNLYYVLNTVNKPLIPGKPNETNNNNSNNNNNNISNPRSKDTSFSHTQPPQQEHPTALRSSATTANLPSANRKSALKTTYKSFNGLFPLVSQRFQQPHPKNSNDNLINNNNNNKNDDNHMHNNENNSTNQPIVVTGFDTNTLITKTRIKSKSNSRSSSRSSTRSLSSDNGKNRENRNINKKINNKNFSTDNSTTDMKSKYSKYNTNNDNNLNLPQQNKDSLFVSSSSKYNNGNIKDPNTANNTTNRIFFSSEEEEEEDSEWNSLSSDDDDYVYDDYSDDEEEDRLRKNRNRKSLAETFSNEDDEEEDDDDQYYKRQWNKLVFTKQSKMKATISPPDSISSSVEKINGRLTPSNSHEQIIRKSLLSGLFSNEKHNNNSNNTALSPSDKLSSRQIQTSSATASSTASSKTSNHHHPLPATSNIAHANTDIITTTTTVTAHGSVTAAKDPMNAIVPLEEMIQRERRGRQMNRPLADTNSRKMSRRSSYNSLFSDEDEIEGDLYDNNDDDNEKPAEIERGRTNKKGKGNFSHTDLPQDTRSNAPLTAQTILPTALSTHMFLPNSIVQQKKSSGNGGGVLPQNHIRPTPIQRRQAEPAVARRDSIDIPTKNRSQLLLKTRMEISEEEKRARRKRQGNVN